MISTNKGFLFVHVPRTGGNTIQSVLMPYADDLLLQKDSKQHQFELRAKNGQLTKHSKLSQYYRVLGEDDACSMYKFTSIRNPWDRLLSRWFLFRFGPENNPKTRGRWVFRRRVQPKWNSLEFRKYLEWKLQKDGVGAWSIMPFITIEDQVAIDDYIRFGSLVEDLRRICSRLELSIKSIPRLNKSRSRFSFKRYYDSTARDLVSEVCRDEIEYFGFKFDD